MAEYTLYCFAQSGNAFKAALMLNVCQSTVASPCPEYTFPSSQGPRTRSGGRGDLVGATFSRDGAQEVDPLFADNDIIRIE